MEAVALNTEIISVIGLLALTVFLFISDKVRVDVVGIIVLVLIGLSATIPGYSGLVDPSQLFRGFSSNAVMSIIAVMIIGAGLDKTGAMSKLAAIILRYAGKTEKRIMIVISLVVAYISSFMQNIGAAALFLPVVNRISRRTGIPAARLLMPMGFCAILGGTITMVGSSPLILLNELLENANQTLPSGVKPIEPFGLFAVAPIGISLVATAIIYFVLFGRKMLPVSKKQTSASDSLQHFRDIYGIDGRLFEVEVGEDSPLIDKRLGDIATHGRAGWILGIKNDNNLQIIPSQETAISAGSILAIMGSKREVTDYADINKLTVRPFLADFAELLSNTNAGIAELVIPPDSKLVGKTVSEISFRRTYQTRVLAVYRVDTILDENLSQLEFQAGDTVVVHSRWQDLVRFTDTPDFAIVTDFPKETFRPNKLVFAAISFFIAISLVLFSNLPISVALLTGAIGMVLTGVLSMDEGYKAVSWQTVFLLASLIPLGMAMEKTGTANWIAFHILELMEGLPAWSVQLFLATLTTIFTLVMSNVGATILLVPIAIKMAIGLGVSPAMFALTVALAASNSFLLPTHQVNALIMGPAGYKVTDFMRVGGIMTVVVLVLIVGLLNVFF